MASDTSTQPRQVGNYDLLAKIAEGGMGAVYKARSLITGDIVAIKIVPSETAKNPILLKRFEQEFRAASLLDHPNIVKAIEYCGTGASPFLVMEFVDGESLGQRVERDGAVAEAVAIHIISQVCDGLHRAHKQGLIHRDVKPDNILVTLDGIAKLTDMGLVKDVEGELNLTKTGRGLGTPHFMAPEQFRNAKNADVRCDIYSLGATLYMMVTGEVPFTKTSPLDCWMKKIKNDFAPPKQVCPKLGDRVNRAILRAMSADPAARPASCREFIEDLTGQTWKNRADTSQSSTRLQNRTPTTIPMPENEPVADIWYLVYKTPDGQQKTVKGTTERIQENLKAGTLGDPSAILVCRTKTGPFEPVRAIPEFRVLVVDPASVAASSVPSATRSSAESRDTLNARQTVPNPTPSKRTRPPAAMPITSEKPPPSRVPRERPAKTKFPRNTAPARELPKWLPWVMIATAIAATIVGILLMLK